VSSVTFHGSRGVLSADEEEARELALSAVEEKRTFFPEDIVDLNYTFHFGLLFLFMSHLHLRAVQVLQATRFAGSEEVSNKSSIASSGWVSTPALHRTQCGASVRGALSPLLNHQPSSQ